MHVLDGSGREWPGRLETLGKTRATVKMGEPFSPQTEPSIQITVAQALPKMAEKMETVLQHGTEIGAVAFWAFQSAKSLPHLTGERHEKRLGRWAAIVKTAAEQAGRARLPSLRVEGDLNDVLSAARDYDITLFAHPEADRPLKDVLRDAPAARTVLVIVGPGKRLHSTGSQPGAKALRLARPARSAHGNGGVCPAVTNTICMRRCATRAPEYGLRRYTVGVFVDIHNHILPGIDDGARTMAEAVEMARRAAAGGTDILVATPHQFWPGRRGAPADWLRGLVLELQSMIDREKIPLRVVPGVEAKIGLHVVEELQHGEVLTLGDAGRWVLMEPPFDRIPPGALSTLREVRQAGFQVVLAHPERSRATFSRTSRLWKPAPISASPFN